VMAVSPFIEIDVDGFTVKITNPQKPFFSERGETKLDLVNYYLSVGDGILRALRERPTYVKRHIDGAESDPIYQKRLPTHAPPWIETVTVRFPSGRSAAAACPTKLADIIWLVNTGTIDFHPWPSRRADTERPDEMRLDLDPQPGTDFVDAQLAIPVMREMLDELGMVGWPKTSGNRGIHVYVRIEPRWSFTEVRRAALAFGRELERRMPDLITTKWWKEERGEKVFLDFNQNARDRTIASAYSVRARPDATVSTPTTWEEIVEVSTRDFTIATVPARFALLGDVHRGIDDAVCSLDPLLAWASRDEDQGIGEAPYPPQYPKMEGEPMRVQPSRARKPVEPDGDGA
ncbi:MAG: hypothetical protein QOF39_749, partial [Frankiales bacterium]|nr:hypothetical protein [Frankiales bacterium]